MKYVTSVNTSANCFTFLMKIAETFDKPHLLYDGILECVSYQPNYYKIWKSNYKKYLNLTTDIFKHVSRNTASLQWVFADEEFKSFVIEINNMNKELEVENVLNPKEFKKLQKVSGLVYKYFKFKIFVEFKKVNFRFPLNNLKNSIPDYIPAKKISSCHIHFLTTDSPCQPSSHQAIDSCQIFYLG